MASGHTRLTEPALQSRGGTSGAIFSPGIPGLPRNPFGKDMANIGLWRALARHGGFDELCILLNQTVDPEELRTRLLNGRASATRITTTGFFDTATIARVGTLLRGSADLIELAWQRRHALGDRGYSLVGLVHTIAPPAIRQYIAQCAVAPIQPWDALICTSPVVRQNLQDMFESWNEYLRGRFGGGAAPPRRPMLPLVPLGVDAEAMAAAADRADIRAATRARLSIGEDDVLVLWLGRLSFYEKAFPQPMFQAVEQAQRRTVRRLHFVMLGWFPDREEGRRRYEEAALAHAPSVSVHILDGNDRALVASMWAAADIFLSLVDNIQETFGMTLTEAMAAGLPVVASDWDGYRTTLQHGRQGVLVPTLGGPPGLGARMLQQHLFGLDAYQRYVGTIAQYTAVNIAKAAEALAALADDPELRRKMGASGRDRARSVFDWPIVARQLSRLVEELTKIRSRSSMFEGPREGQRHDPVRSEPFSTFAAFASAVLQDETRLRVSTGIHFDPAGAFRAAELNRFAAHCRADVADSEAIYRMLLERGETTVDELLSGVPRDRRGPLRASVLWMCKLGLIDWR